jgi:hypothetical protein
VTTSSRRARSGSSRKKAAAAPLDLDGLLKQLGVDVDVDGEAPRGGQWRCVRSGQPYRFEFGD